MTISNKKDKLIAVLMGGWNSEREVSINSGNSVCEALSNLGYKFVKIDFSRDIFNQLQQTKPDIVFNALHGQYGEDGRIQSILDVLQIPYTHSGALASTICMDKVITRKLCLEVGAKIPKYEILKQGEVEKNQEKIFLIEKPFVIKPISEGSSVGVEVILENMDFNIKNYQWLHGKNVIIEQYIAGTELNVAIIDGKAIGVLEVRPHGLFYDYKCKYTKGMTDYIMPAEIPQDKYQEALKVAQDCHNLIGCKGISRVEFILNNKNGGDGNLYLLEINTHPGFTSTSIVPKIAKYNNISFEEIVDFLIKEASHD